MDKYKKTYRIPATRLQDWDYGSHGLYFVTICTKDKEHYFGEIHKSTESKMNQESLSVVLDIVALHPTKIGEIANQFWKSIPQHFPFAEIDEFILMPNHMHGIIFINRPEYESCKANKFGPQSGNLASVIRGYKAAVKKHATINQIEFTWQSRYYDRVIRSERELQNIRNYIFNNPAKWEIEKNNPENLFM